MYTRGEIADQFGTTEEVIDLFLDKVWILGDRFTDEQFGDIEYRWEATGAREQWDRVGRLGPRTDRERYERHLESTTWDRVRREALKRAEYRCQICNRSVPLSGHHRSYDRLGTDKEILDVLAICSACHDFVHKYRMPRGD